MATTKKGPQTRKGRKGGRKPGIAKAHRKGSSVPKNTGGRSRNAGTFIARNSWFSLVYESMTDAFVRVDMKGYLKDFNKPFVHMVGYEARELRKMTYRDLTPEQWHEAESGIITQQVLTRGYSELYEKEYRRKDGSTVPVELRTILLRNERGRPIGMWALIRDSTARKHVEEQLRLTEEKFAKAFHLSPDAVNINRLSDGTYLAINEGFSKITGYTADEVIGRSSLPGDLGLWIRQEDRDQLVAGLRERGEVSGLEAAFRMKDGTVKLGVMSAKVMQLDNELCIFSVTRDITERRRADEALRRSEAEHRHLIETMPDGVYRSTHDGKFLEVNPAMVKILGYSSKEELMAIDIPTQLYFAPADRESAALEEKLEEMAIFRLRKKDGSEVWVEDHGRHVLGDDGRVLYHEGILRDVTARTKGEELLRASEERMRAIIEGTPQQFFYTQDAAGNTTYVSPTVEHITGYTSEVWMKQRDWFITDAEVNKRAVEVTHARLSGERIGGPLMLEIRRRDGRPILLEVYEHPVMKNGKVVGLQGVAHDVTEQKHAEEALVRSLKEKEVLLKEIHHRVKNNLQVICSMLNMQASEAHEEGVTTALQEAQARVLSMALIHERLYSVADFSRIDLLEYSQSLANHLARTWKRTGIRVSIGGSRTFVGVDAAIPYGLILNELVTNALKHAFVGREKGQVDVTVERKSDTSVEMGVRDDGIGFPPGKDFKDMVSMGMTLVTNLVAQLNGTITLMDSDGAHFVIQFTA